MRPDAVGIFWQDIPVSRSDRKIARVMPAIPETGWLPPREFPDLSSAPYISLDTETKDPDLLDFGPGWGRGKGNIIGISVGVPGKNWYFPMRHEVMPEHNLNPDHVLAWARDTLGNPKQPKVGANLIYDIGWLEHEGVPVKGIAYDVQLAEALIDEVALTNLDALGEKYLNRGKETSVMNQWLTDFYGGSIHDQRKNLYRCPPCLVGPYAEMDTDLPQQILPQQWAIMEREGLLELFDMECRLVPLLIAMRRAGVSVDIGKAERIRDNLIVRVADLDKEIKRMVGFEVNCSAHESLAKAFRHLGVEIPIGPKGKPSFAKELLKGVEHDIADVILERKKLEKVRSTFIESYILQSHVKGKIYCEFHPLRSDRGGTRSGRFASSNPNLQNVPSRDEELAPLVRGAFVPDEGHTSWTRFDYSQIEYRELAHFAVGQGSDELREQYIRDPKTDYHIHTQQLVARLTGQEIPRKPIKNINFGLTYGMGMAKLARSLGLDKKAAEALFEAYHLAAPFTKATMEHFAQHALNLGYIKTILGRRSRFDLWEPDVRGGRGDDRLPALPYHIAINKYGKIKRAFSHKALNRVLQGSAADLMKKAMLHCWESGVFNYTGVPRLTVHDELDFSNPGGKEDGFAYIKHILENAIPHRVPILCEREDGPSWGEAH